VKWVRVKGSVYGHELFDLFSCPNIPNRSRAMQKPTVFAATCFIVGLMWSTVSAADIDRCVFVGDQLMKRQISEPGDLAIPNVDYGKPCMKSICARLSDIGRLEEFVRSGEEQVVLRAARSASVNPLGWNRACTRSGKNRLDVKECLMLRRFSESLCYKIVLWALS